MNDEPRKMIYIGSYDSGVHHLTIPAAVTRPVVAAFDAERAQRELEVSRAKLKVMQDARARSKLKKAMHAVFGFRRGRRGR